MRRLLLATLATASLGGGGFYYARHYVDLEKLAGPPIIARDENSRVRDMGERAVPALVSGLKNPKARVRAVCLSHLERLHQPQTSEAIVACLQDPDSEVRGAAARALRRIPGGDPQRLVDLLTAKEDYTIRRAALEALAFRAYAPAAPLAAAVLADDQEHPEVRNVALDLLAIVKTGRVGRSDCEPGEPPALAPQPIPADVSKTVARLIADPQLSWKLRRKVCWRLADLGELELALKCLQDSELDSDLRADIAVRLYRLPIQEQPRAIAALENVALNEDSPQRLRIDSAYSLFKMGRKLKAQFLIDALKSEDHSMRELAARTIGESDQDELFEALEQAQAAEKNRRVLGAIKKALGQ